MDLMEALAQTKPQVGASCSVGLMLSALTGDEHAQAASVLEKDSGYSNAHLSRAFGLAGHKLHEGSVRRHRAGECRCEPV
jgi:hypothetical protein